MGGELTEKQKVAVNATLRMSTTAEEEEEEEAGAASCLRRDCWREKGICPALFSWFSVSVLEVIDGTAGSKPETA